MLSLSEKLVDYTTGEEFHLALKQIAFYSVVGLRIIPQWGWEPQRRLRHRDQTREARRSWGR